MIRTGGHCLNTPGSTVGRVTASRIAGPLGQIAVDFAERRIRGGTPSTGKMPVRSASGDLKEAPGRNATENEIS